MVKRILLLGFILFAAWKSYVAFSLRPVNLGAGEKAPNDPRQINCPANAPEFTHKGFSFTPLADYEITAKVLSKKRYRMDACAKLSPIDFALGWGRMSDESILEKIHIRQQVRYYIWKPLDRMPPIPYDEISAHSANCHLIPATPEVKQALLKTRTGSIVHITGKLVRAEKENWCWKSSLTRTDTGNGACEVIWVDSVKTVMP